MLFCFLFVMHFYSATQLFEKVLARLEKDYNPKDRNTNLVEEVSMGMADYT